MACKDSETLCRDRGAGFYTVYLGHIGKIKKNSSKTQRYSLLCVKHKGPFFAPQKHEINSAPFQHRLRVSSHLTCTWLGVEVLISLHLPCRALMVESYGKPYEPGINPRFISMLVWSPYLCGEPSSHSHPEEHWSFLPVTPNNCLGS